MDSNLPKVSVVALRHPQFQNLFLHGLRSDNQKWTLPGGHANPGETPKETASRELKEETGLEGIQLEDARNDQLGKESDRVHVHLFTGVCPEGKKLNATSDPDSEFVTYKFLDPSNHNNMHIDSDRNILLHHLGSMIHKTITLEKENEIIAENKKKPEAKVKHKFKAAHWTHPNGHPRCFICGDEERIDGECIPETTEDLGKGAMQRMAPFNPKKDVKHESRDSMFAWQNKEVRPARANLANKLALAGNPRTRALHKLHAKTVVRKNPTTGEREFLLHRAMGQQEFRQSFKKSPDSKQRFIEHNTPTSWTPTPSGLSELMNEGDENYQGMASAWIPESKIKHVPKQLGNFHDSPMKNKYANEHEVIIAPHRSEAVHADEVMNLIGQSKYSGTKAPNTVDRAINMRVNHRSDAPSGIPRASIGHAYLRNRLKKSQELEKSKNVREQKKKVFGTQSTPPKGSEMREKHIQHIKDFTNKFLGIDFKPSGGKINEKTGQRKKAQPKIGMDKPDWRSGQLEAQWNPDAIVHEIAHLMLLPKGIGLQAGQKYMDKQYGDIQGKYGYMSQKRSQGEVQPMAAENIIRRHLGLPATNVGMDVGADPFAVPERTSVEDPNQVIGNRVPQRKPSGDIKWIDLIRQSQFLSPTNKQRLEDIFNGKLKFHHQNGWVEAKPEHPKRNLRSLLPHKAWKTEPAGIPQHFSMISAQHNEVHNKAAHEKLRQELSNHGFQPQEVTGHYGYPEKSFMVPHTGSIDDRKAIEILGGQFGQESVLHSSNLKNHLVHLQDPSKSKEGVGHSNDFSDNMFTELPGGHKMKLNLNKGDEDLLYHYSRHEEPIDEIDPAKHGTGTPGAERKRSPTLPRSYYYDTPVGHEPDVVSGARHLYRILKPKKIIDINGPEAKIYKEKAKNQYGILDHNALEQHLRDAGYHGYKNTGSALPNVVALFDKQKVHSEGKISKLGKKMLNPEMGVSFKVHPLGDTGAKRWPTTAIGMNKRFDPKQHDVRITAHLPNGQQIGTTDLVHSLAGMNPINIQVDPKFQRKGIGSAMYQHAEKHTGKKVIPSIDQSPDAQKFWKQKNRNFGR